MIMDDTSTIEWIRNYLSRDKGIELRYDLSRFRYLVSKYIPSNHKENNQLIWFKSNEAGFKWADNPILELTKDTDGRDIYKFENSFKTTGNLGYSYKYDEFEVPVSLSLTYLVYKYPDGDKLFPDHMALYSEGQMVEMKYFHAIENKLKDLGFERGPENLGISFDKINDIWGNLNFGHSNELFPSSHAFWTDMYSDVSLLLDLIGEIEFYSDYLSDLGIRYFRNEPSVHLSRYDKQFLNKCSFIMHTTYSFWEKVAFVIFKFYGDVSNVTSKNLSFYKLLTNLKADVEGGKISLPDTSSEIKWFLNFNEEGHKLLREYRHPLVHYKPENDMYKGGLYASFLNYYYKNISNDSGREELDGEMTRLKKFSIAQVELAVEGFEKLIKLTKNHR